MLADEMNILSDESLVRMAQEGSSLAYELLLDKYKHKAKISARKYYIAGAENEDVIQEAMIGIFMYGESNKDSYKCCQQAEA